LADGLGITHVVRSQGGKMFTDFQGLFQLDQSFRPTIATDKVRSEFHTYPIHVELPIMILGFRIEERLK
jgi:hypothetical protein